MDRIRIACYSDIHKHLLEPVECDLALIAGDLCGSDNWVRQIGFLQGPFSEWLAKFKYSIFIAGNHDGVFETMPGIIPRFPWNSRYLNESEFSPTHPMSGWMWKRKPLSFYGLPWSLPYGNYNFMCDEETMYKKLRPARSSDIILVHGPPYGLGDEAPRYHNGQVVGTENTGSMVLRAFIDEYQPKLVVCGHIHESRGIYHCGKTTVINAAMAGFARDEYDRCRSFIAHKPYVVTLDESNNITDISES